MGRPREYDFHFRALRDVPELQVRAGDEVTIETRGTEARAHLLRLSHDELVRAVLDAPDAFGFESIDGPGYGWRRPAPTPAAALELLRRKLAGVRRNARRALRRVK